MKKQINSRIDETLYNELNALATEQNTSLYKVIENALIIGVKYMRKKGLGIDSAIKLLVSAYNVENPDNRIIVNKGNR